MDEVRLSLAGKTEADDLAAKVEHSLLESVYLQSVTALSAAFFCAIILFVGLYTPHNYDRLMIWAMFFVAVMLIRIVVAIIYKMDALSSQRINLWRNIYIIGSFFGGVSWGLAGIMLLPEATAPQQMLLVFMLAGVTAGVVPLSAAVPKGALAFLVFSTLPFIYTIANFHARAFDLFNLCLTVYLVYSIFLVLKNYRLAVQSITLTLENIALLNKLEVINKHLEQAATHDPLTQVANRRLFETNLNAAIHHARKYNKNLALLFLDLDKFKNINDLYGHEAGDQTLLIIIDRLRKFFRREDNISRLGGDEFAVIIENFMTKDDLVAIARKVCTAIAEPIDWNGIELKVGVSVGIAIYPDDGASEDELLHSADINMYYVKEKGGNNFNFTNKTVTEI